MPVILIFTKFGSQEAVAYRLLKQQYSIKALSKAQRKHGITLTKNIYLDSRAENMRLREYIMFICIWISRNDCQDMDKDGVQEKCRQHSKGVHLSFVTFQP